VRRRSAVTRFRKPRSIRAAPCTQGTRNRGMRWRFSPSGDLHRVLDEHLNESGIPMFELPYGAAARSPNSGLIQARFSVDSFRRATVSRARMIAARSRNWTPPLPVEVSWSFWTVPVCRRGVRERRDGLTGSKRSAFEFHVRSEERPSAHQHLAGSRICGARSASISTSAPNGMGCSRRVRRRSPRCDRS
jgi:hypothetical protein